MSPAPSLAWADILLVLVMAIISAITVAGNLVVMLSFVLDRQIRQPSNFFIFSLAVSDLVIGLEGIPVYTYFLVNGQRWPFGAFLCDLWLSVDYACCLASIYTVLGITADRYMSVKFPAAYRNWRTQRRVLLIIAGIWLIPSVLFSVSIFGYGWFSGKGRILREDECYVQFMTNAYLNMGMYISYYWSTLVLMLYLYYGIYSAAKQLARKSDQKQKRLAILSEMRAQEQGNNPPKNDNKGAAAAAAQQNEPPSVYPSEANATLEGDSLDSRPVRNSTARLWQNGRLMSLRSILSGDDRLTGGGKRGTGVAHTEANKPPEQTQRSSTLTTAANNLSSSEAKDTESQRQEERVADTQKADGEPEIEMSAQARQMDEERSRLEGAFSPEKLSSCGEDNYCFPFIDESSNSSVEEAHQKEDLQQQCQQQTAVAPINGRSAEVRNNNAGGEEEEHRGLGALFRASRLPDQSHSALSSCCSRGLSSQQLLPQSCNTTIDFALEPPCVNASASDEQQTEDNSNNEQQQHPHMSAAAPQSTIARLDVQVERQFRGEQRLAGMRRWLLAMGRWERITLKGGGRRKAPSSANSRAPPGARERKTAAQQQLRKMSKSSQSRSENRARKALRTITVILGTFILFWTPFYVLATVYGFCERCTNSAGFQALYTISYYLCYMNSPINPLCYAMANQQFKRAFKRILRGDLRRS